MAKNVEIKRLLVGIELRRKIILELLDEVFCIHTRKDARPSPGYARAVYS